MAIVGRVLSVEREIKERTKEILLKIKQRKLRSITLHRAIEESPILLLQYWKK